MNLLVKISYLLILISAIVFLKYPFYAPYLMSVGCAGVCVGHLRMSYTGKNLRLRRAYRLRRIVLTVCYLSAAYFMFYPGLRWVPVILIAALIELYTIWIITKEEKNETYKS